MVSISGMNLNISFSDSCKIYNIVDYMIGCPRVKILREEVEKGLPESSKAQNAKIIIC